jgi:epoxyqueuosine reductase
MEETRRILEERKAAGLSATMQFTYRNPVRSTDPSRLLPGAAALVVGAWPYGGRGTVGTPSDGRPPSGRPKGIVARYASRDHYADLGAALGGQASAGSAKTATSFSQGAVRGSSSVRW